MLSLIYSFKLYICKDPRIARAFTAQNEKKNCAYRLSRSASIRVHVEVWNGYGRARGVGAGPRRRRSNEAILTENSSTANRILRPRHKKTTAIWLVTCMIGRAKKLGLLGQSLLTKLAIIYAVAIRLTICIMYVI